MSFKVGQRVRYVNPDPMFRVYFGREATVLQIVGNNIVADWVIHGYGPQTTRQSSVTLAEPLSALEQSIAAYVAQEKKELGLS